MDPKEYMILIVMYHLSRASGKCKKVQLQSKVTDKIHKVLAFIVVL